MQCDEGGFHAIDCFGSGEAQEVSHYYIIPEDPLLDELMNQ